MFPARRVTKWRNTIQRQCSATQHQPGPTDSPLRVVSVCLSPYRYKFPPVCFVFRTLRVLTSVPFSDQAEAYDRLHREARYILSGLCSISSTRWHHIPTRRLRSSRLYVVMRRRWVSIVVRRERSRRRYKNSAFNNLMPLKLASPQDHLH